MATTFRHILSGTYAGIDTWMTGVYSVDLTNSVPSAHTVWLNAINELWAPGSVGNNGWARECSSSVVATKATTYTLLPFSIKKTGKAETSLNVAGTGAGFAIPNTVAPMVLLDQLGNLGRFSGRMYLPAADSTRWLDGRLDDEGFPTLLSCVQKAFLAMIAGGLHPCTIDARTGEFREVTDIRASNKAAVRKSRDDGPALYSKAHVFP